MWNTGETILLHTGLSDGAGHTQYKHLETIREDKKTPIVLTEISKDGGTEYAISEATVTWGRDMDKLELSPSFSISLRRDEARRLRDALNRLDLEGGNNDKDRNS